MEDIKKIGLLTLIILINIGCRNSSQSKVAQSQTKDYDSMEETNDWYEDTDGNSKTLKLVRANGKIGFLYENGEELFPCIFDSVVDAENYAYGNVNGKCVPTNKVYFSPYAKVKKDGKWGLISSEGKVIISFNYDDIYTFDYKKTSRMEGPYIEYFDYNGETAIVKRDGKWGLVNKKDEVLADCVYDEFYIPDVQLFYEKRAAAKKDGLWGFLNEKGELVVPFMYNDILVSEEVSVEGGRWFFSQDGYCAVKKNGKWGLIDKYNNIIVNFEFDSIKFTSYGLEDWRYFSEGFLAVQKGKCWSVINKKGLNHIHFEYDDVEIWSEGNVCVKKNSKWGLVDSTGKQLVPI
ncbi:WG repeat-containing protein [Tenuifilum thalassicum]|uniref:WG repeat-containing protein n=1 Tax=Tenuifilum thalassicum TaxID=2590900 RepID=A0A7D3XN73_9BACT|nr:WG repeat-containing protein [Tenuifilum thalassicum]QKG80816.1 WG repeat-containing protein [Tenuifilum thalassicum]